MMTRTLQIGLAFCFSALPACATGVRPSQTSLDAATKRDASAKPPAAPACGLNQSYVPFTLASVDPMPDLKPAEAKDGKLTLLSPDDSIDQIRFDVCVDDQGDSAVLRQIVLKTELFNVPPFFSAITPASKGVAEGVAEAIFGDTSKLRLYFDYGGNMAMLVKGFVAGGTSYVYFAQGLRGDIKDFDSDRFVVGTLENRDPFAEDTGDCSASLGFFLAKTMRTIPTAKGDLRIETISCNINSFGTLTEEWRSVKILDPGAPGGLANKEYSAEAGKEPAGFSYQYLTMHHNACVEYLIEAPHATYALTIKNVVGNIGHSATGCGGMIPGTPVVGGGREEAHTAIRIAYPDQKPVELLDPEMKVEITRLGQ